VAVECGTVETVVIGPGGGKSGLLGNVRKSVGFVNHVPRPGVENDVSEQ
jgi:hypothetical protein